MEYVLTAKGEDLRPVIRALAEWGVKHAGGRLPADAVARLRANDRPV